jgi:hypothetical protein
MTDHHVSRGQHRVDDLERWLETHERIWIPSTVLAVLAVMVWGAFSLAHTNYYWTNYLPYFRLGW